MDLHFSSPQKWSQMLETKLQKFVTIEKSFLPFSNLFIEAPTRRFASFQKLGELEQSSKFWEQLTQLVPLGKGWLPDIIRAISITSSALLENMS